MPVSPTAFDAGLASAMRVAIAQNPATPPSPTKSKAKTRNATWDEARRDVPAVNWQASGTKASHPAVALPRQASRTKIKTTQTSVSGRLAPVTIPRWAAATSVATTTAAAKPSSPSLLGSVGSWLSRQVSGAYESVRYGMPFVGSRNDSFLVGKQNKAVAVARTEYAAGVKEVGSTNTGKRVNVYAKAAKMDTGQEWCGFFVGYAYSQNGFKKPEMLASGYKAQLLYLYRTMTSADPDLAAHKAQGQTRQYFVFPESPSRAYLKENAKLFPQYNLAANTFAWNTLPVRAGDTVLFEHGGSSGIPDHVGIVESYDRLSGRLVTIEGNVGNKVVRKTYDLRDPAVRRTVSGFGRPAPGDFV